MKGSAFRKKTKASKAKRILDLSSEESDSDVEMELASEFDCESSDEGDVADVPEVLPTALLPEVCAVHDYVVVKFNGEKFQGAIVSKDHQGAMVKCMAKGNKCWRWSE